MSNGNTSSIVQKVWSFCNTLRDDGVGYGDYLEQLTYLLFLKMADEYSKPPYNRKLPIPKEYTWDTLTTPKGAALETHYNNLLRNLAKEKNILGQIFTKSQNKIQDPAKLSRLIDLIDKEQWSTMAFDYVLANPPFGKKSSMTFTNEEGEQEKEELTYNRQDFWVTTSNKQLNFVQHIRTMLKTDGRAAVVVPDNVLFEGGAGETVRKQLLDKTDLHTILRLSTGIFYANGVKANVLFFDNKPAAKEPWTKEVWIFDYRTNTHHTLKKNRMQFEDLQEFIECYNPKNRHKRKATWSETNPDGRWRKFTYDEIINRDKTSLDITWIKDKSLADLDNLPDPDLLAEEIVENLEAGLENFREIIASINGKKL